MQEDRKGAVMTDRTLRAYATIVCDICGMKWAMLGDDEEDVWVEIDRQGWSTDGKVDEKRNIVGRCPHHLDPGAVETSAQRYKKALEAVLKEACGGCAEPESGVCDETDCGSYPYRKIARETLFGGKDRKDA